MKIHLKNIHLTTILLLMVGCSGNTDEPKSSAENTEYYVKYEAVVTSRYITNNISYTVAAENQNKTFQSGKTFSETFGPVRKGFKASITANATNLSIADCSVSIYVSRGSEPFALKANKSGGRLVSTSYTIDY
ncbi:MAG: hypothetical protein K2K97_04285 [Muribaculaceae bacterium]|nr:hypothetical protein [Muribaculaceae bacterium]